MAKRKKKAAARKGPSAEVLRRKRQYATWTRKRFTGREDLVARVAFSFKGVSYAPGDPFPWRKVANQTKAQNFWRVRYVNVAEPVKAEAVETEAN